MRDTESALELRRTIPISAKLNDPEADAFEALKRELGGKVASLNDADTIRYALALACKSEKIPWPGGAS